MKCNRCGNVNAAGLEKCLLCGEKLISDAEGGMSQKNMAPQQPELPAWLETLRAGERSVPAAHSSNFTTADLIDEGNVPSWMRTEREARDVTGASRPVTFPPGSPMNGGMEAAPAPQNFQVQSLIDEQSLPSWMRGNNAPATPSNNVAASNVTQQDDIPDWMKSLHQQQTRMTPAVPTDNRQSQAATPEPKAPSQNAGFSARDLVDPQSLPSWMTPQSGQSGGVDTPRMQDGNSGIQFGTPSEPPMDASLPQAGPAGFSARDLVDPQSLPSWMTPQSGQSGSASPKVQSGNNNIQFGTPSEPPIDASLPQVGPAGFSARDLVDPQALPSWMTPQGGQTSPTFGTSHVQNSNNQANTSSEPPIDASLPQAGPAGFSARDLVDPQALPSWMAPQNANQAPSLGNAGSLPPSSSSGQGALAASSLLDPDSLPSWLNPQGQQSGTQGAPQSAPVSMTPQGNSTISASSFLDHSALPEWMKAMDPNARASAQPAQGQAGRPQPGYMGPPRVENVRVPSRPRGEVGMNENNEVAANVFASMLGVAAAPTPNFPGENMSQPPMAPPSQPTQQPGYMGPENPVGGSGSAQPGVPSGLSPSWAGIPNPVSASGVPNTPSGMMRMQQSGYNPNMAGMPGASGGPGTQPSMAGNMYGAYPGNNPPQAPAGNPSLAGTPGMNPAGARPVEGADGQKNAKKRGLFGAFLDWLNR